MTGVSSSLTTKTDRSLVEPARVLLLVGLIAIACALPRGGSFHSHTSTSKSKYAFCSTCCSSLFIPGMHAPALAVTRENSDRYVSIVKSDVISLGDGVVFERKMMYVVHLK